MIKKYGYTDFFAKQVEDIEQKEGLVVARVTEVHREQLKIVSDHGETNAKLKSAHFYKEGTNNTYPAVGDFVLVKHNPQGEDLVYLTLHRQSKFSRLDSHNEIEQVVATNFDYVFIMTSLNNDINVNRIERYLATAWQSGGTPVIVLTKVDLCENYEALLHTIKEVAIGVEVIPISSRTGDGLAQIGKYIQPGKTIVFLGSSGVGKSTLVNAIAGEEVMKVNEIREEDSKGKHTTTHRQLIMLKQGAMIIDTPGMRELGMWNVGEGVEATFGDIDSLAKQCRFHDCSHDREPGCAVRRALKSGDLPQSRWDNYIKLKKEARYAMLKENNAVRSAGKDWHKSIAKIQKEHYKYSGKK